MLGIERSEHRRAARSGISVSTQENRTLRRVALVEHFPMFANVAEGDRKEIISAARETKFSRRRVIFQEGDAVRTVVLLTAGVAKVVQLGKDGSEVIRRLVASGAVVGLTEFRSQGPYVSTAQAHSDCTALVWEANVFEAFADRFPLLGRNIMNIVFQLWELEERYREIYTEKVAVRVSRQLVRLLNQAGRRVNGNIEISFSCEELAQLTGTTLFTVNRLLTDWSLRGLVKARRQSVSVHNIQGLRELAESQ